MGIYILISFGDDDDSGGNEKDTSIIYGLPMKLIKKAFSGSSFT